MIKQIGAAIVLALMMGAGAARAADTDRYLSLHADPTTAYVEAATGRAHAYFCLSKTAVLTPGDFCYGFFPQPAGLTSLTLGNGHVLKRVGAEWVETPGDFHFVRQPGPADNVVLFDAKRQVTWVLGQPRGGSIFKTGKARQAGPNVKAVTFDDGAAAFIGGNAKADDFQEIVVLPTKTDVAFWRKIGPAQAAAVDAAIAQWNAGGHHLNDDDYLSALSAVAAGGGAKLPVHMSRKTPADFITALAKMNR